MGIADPEAALKKLREFRDMLVADERALREGSSPTAFRQRNELQHLIERIANELDPDPDDDGAGNLGGRFNVLLQSWTLGGAIARTGRLIGILENRSEYERMLGPVGPTLAASQLHPWVWNAVASLWDDGHYELAVHEAAKAVELKTQLKVDRRNLDGKDLHAHAFSTKDPKPGEPRLRFPDIPPAEQPKRWTSAHEGAQYLGMGCAQGIRNPQAHPSDDITEQEALEQLAALSVLARWVDECDVVSVANEAAGE